MNDRRVTPSTHLVAETRLIPEGRKSFLDALGASAWTTDANSDAEELMEIAGKSCYMSFDTALNKNLTRVGTRANGEYIADSILRMKHFSVLEHASVTFGFVNVSRVFTHELVRHRHLSYSQVSGRYVRTDKIRAWLPRVIADNPSLVAIFDDAFDQMEANVARLEEASQINYLPASKFAQKKILTSAFRRIIGNGQANHILATGNHRSWREIIALRTSAAAEEEVRMVFNHVYSIMKARYPSVYGDAIEKDVDGYREISFGYNT